MNNSLTKEYIVEVLDGMLLKGNVDNIDKLRNGIILEVKRKLLETKG